MPSAAMSVSIAGRRPAASSASARCTVVSCTIRRDQKRTCLSAPHAHIGVEGSAPRSEATTAGAPSASQVAQESSSAGSSRSSSEPGMRSAARTATRWAAHLCTPPMWRARSDAVHPGQVGTGVPASRAAIAADRRGNLERQLVAVAVVVEAGLVEGVWVHGHILARPAGWVPAFAPEPDPRTFVGR